MDSGLDVLIFLLLFGSFFDGFLVVPELFESEIEVVFAVVRVAFFIFGRHLVDLRPEPRPEPRPEGLPTGELRDEEVLKGEPKKMSPTFKVNFLTL